MAQTMQCFYIKTGLSTLLIASLCLWQKEMIDGIKLNLRREQATNGKEFEEAVFGFWTFVLSFEFERFDVPSFTSPKLSCAGRPPFPLILE